MARILNALNSHRHFHIAVQVRAVTHTATLYQHSHDLASFFSWGGGGGAGGRTELTVIVQTHYSLRHLSRAVHKKRLHDQ